jgi:adenine-specific DNA-methyltransferase
MDQTRGKYEYDIKTPNGNILSGPWMITEEEFNDLLERDAVHWPDGGEQIPYGKTYLVDQMEKGQISSDFWDSNYGTNQRGATEMKALFGDRAFDFPKPEKLLYNLINIGSKSGDLVLDFFMGSATTQAVAHKMGRQYIGIEQMEYINTLSVPRLQKVIEGEQGGVSRELDWQGGGDFVYLELKELNEEFVQQIYSIDNIDDIKNIYKKLKSKGLLVPSLETKELEKENSFDELSLEQQKDIILSSIDKNKLYVNASQIDDKEIGLTDYEKTLTHNFYGREEFDDREQGTLSI